jgi:hypothetical protein
LDKIGCNFVNFESHEGYFLPPWLFFLNHGAMVGAENGCMDLSALSTDSYERFANYLQTPFSSVETKANYLSTTLFGSEARKVYLCTRNLKPKQE